MVKQPNKKELHAQWEHVEDPDFEEHLRRIFEIIMHEPVEPDNRDVKNSNPTVVF
jgi:hypothetical protein